MARILLIDDDEQLRNAIVKLLTYEGYDIRDTCDGNEGLRLHRENPFDLIITDLIMPGKSGLEIIEEFKNTCPDVSIVAISGVTFYGDEEILNKARKLGVQYTLTKPFTKKKLLSILRDICHE
jgi:CheY-like chemotaxis protein